MSRRNSHNWGAVVRDHAVRHMYEALLRLPWIIPVNFPVYIHFAYMEAPLPGTPVDYDSEGPYELIDTRIDDNSPMGPAGRFLRDPTTGP